MIVKYLRCLREKINYKMIVKYLRWEMWRRKGENKGDACRAVQRGLCEKLICKTLAMIVENLR